MMLNSTNFFHCCEYIESFSDLFVVLLFLKIKLELSTYINVNPTLKRDYFKMKKKSNFRNVCLGRLGYQSMLRNCSLTWQRNIFEIKKNKHINLQPRQTWSIS